MIRFLLLFGHRNIDPAVLGIHIRDYDDPISVKEKNGFGTAGNDHHTNVPSSGVTTGAETQAV